ncbi:unnamed protein product [Adineta ricciae]|uniref:Uncharacterized protein n=1 Tax=Adineta ricciae TaxID=249248 RepID=A0A815T194_ADIRI|nr:unnamed protein product [Adineta ricciae]CAF1619399.1 unnamed protein product [Adineta ricciae]
MASTISTDFDCANIEWNDSRRVSAKSIIDRDIHRFNYRCFTCNFYSRHCLEYQPCVDNEARRRRRVDKMDNDLLYLKSSTEYIRDSFQEYQIRLFGVLVIDRSLVMKILILAVSVAFSKMFKLLEEKVIAEHKNVECKCG